jgi:hypothetical protein
VFELSEVVTQLRAELDEAMTNAAGQRLQFELGPIELALRVTVQNSTTGGGKLRIYVLEAGADGKHETQSAQELKLTLQPVDTQRTAAPEGGSKPPYIGGTSLPGER